MNKTITEKKLGITGDYQYKAINSKNFLQSNWHQNKLSAIEYVLKINKTMEVLDLGTGSGNFELMFNRRVKRILGIDYHQDAVDFLSARLKKERVSNVKVLQLDVKNLSKLPKREKYNLILMVDVIEHLDSKLIKKMIADFSGLLKKNGKVCIITPNYKSYWPILEKLIDILHLLPHLEDEQHVSKLDKETLVELFTKNQYRVIYSSTFNLFSFLLPSKKLTARVCKFELNNSWLNGPLILSVFARDEN